MPDAYKLNMMIRSSIIALNQANQTGNYTVLQDLAAPAFRASNDSARLTQIFAALRQRQLDLTPVLFFTPKLIAEPQIAPNGLLRLTGYFPTAPERVNFDLLYQHADGQWRLFGIGVTTSPAEVTSAVPLPAPGQQSSGEAPTAQAAESAPAAPKTAEAQPTPPKEASKRSGGSRSSRKSQPESQGGSAKQSASAGNPAETAPVSVPAKKEEKVVSGSTNDAARIDLGDPSAARRGEPARAAEGETEAGNADEAPKKQQGLWESLNPFGSD